MLDVLVRAVLAQEGSAALVTAGSEGPHLVATWHSYMEILDDQTIAFPAGGLKKTEANIKAGSPVQMIIGAQGEGGKGGKGYRLTGAAEFQKGTEVHERLRARFPWCRAAVVMTLNKVEKVLG